jgi:hypothetical protein
MTLQLTLPLPHRGLRPNSMVKWQVKYGLTRTAREKAKRAMFEAMKTIEAEVWVIKSYHLNYFFKTSRHWDSDNCGGLSTKAIMDGIADSSKQDDKTFEFTGVSRFTDKTNPRLEVVLEIEELV